MKRMGNRHRPFYRIVVAKSTAARNGAFKELLGTYDPLTQPKQVRIDKERAMHWLMVGAQPTETVAYLLKTQGILEEFFAKRPKAKDKYKFLDKTTGPMSKKSVVQEIPVEAPEAVAPAKEEEPPAAPEAAPVAEAPAEAPADAPAETPAAEAPAAEPEAPKED